MSRAHAIAELTGRGPAPGWLATALREIGRLASLDAWGEWIAGNRYRLAWLEHTGLDPQGAATLSAIRIALEARALALDREAAARAAGDLAERTAHEAHRQATIRQHELFGSKT